MCVLLAKKAVMMNYCAAECVMVCFVLCWS